MKGWRTLFPNAWYVAVREYRSRARSRSFVLGTALLAIIAFAATQLPVLIDFAAAPVRRVSRLSSSRPACRPTH